MSVQTCFFSKLREYLIILLYILHMVVPSNKEDSTFKNFLYNCINQLGLHPSLYINTIYTHYHLHFMFSSCVHLSISIQQVHKNFFSFFSSTSRLTTEFRKQQEIHHGSSIFLCSCSCTAPHLGRITDKSCCCCCTKCSFVHSGFTCNAWLQQITCLKSG